MLQNYQFNYFDISGTYLAQQWLKLFVPIHISEIKGAVSILYSFGNETQCFLAIRTRLKLETVLISTAPQQ